MIIKREETNSMILDLAKELGIGNTLKIDKDVAVGNGEEYLANLLLENKKHKITFDFIYSFMYNKDRVIIYKVKDKGEEIGKTIKEIRKDDKVIAYEIEEIE